MQYAAESFRPDRELLVLLEAGTPSVMVADVKELSDYVSTTFFIAFTSGSA